MTGVTETELKAHAATTQGKRVTLEDLKGNIANVMFIYPPETQLTICIITLKNGYTVTGESACADPKMYNKDIGDRIAQDNAEKKIWPLMGYALKQELYLMGEGTTFQDRVRQEAKELEDKLDKLNVFINGNEHFKELHSIDQGHLVDQAVAMRDYLFILNERINRF